MGQMRRANPATIEFGVRVRRRRLRLHWSQERLAEQAGIHTTYVSSLERGLRNVSLLNILRLCDALGVDPGTLMKGLGQHT